MRLTSSAAFVSCIALLAGGALASDQPYAGFEERAIKSLSEEQVESLLQGRGMSLALAAELNGYPGPLHVLELASELDLSEEQRTEVQRVFDIMQRDAQRLGSDVVEAERELDHFFVEGGEDSTELSRLTGQIAELQGLLRAVHLSAHLALADTLTEEQKLRYADARGYGNTGSGHGHDGHGHWNH